MTHLSTKAGWLEKAYLALCTLLALYVPFHAFFSVALGAVSQQPLLVKAAKELVLVLIVVLGIGILLKWRLLAGRFVHSRLNQLAVGFVVWHFVVALFLHSNVGATLAGLAIDTRFAVFFLVVRLGMLLYDQKLRAYIIRAFVVSAIFVIGFGLLQQYFLPRDILASVGYSGDTIQPYLTVDKNPDFVRINSTLRGPNPLGAYGVMCLLAILAYLSSKGQRLSKKLWTAVGTGLLACLSVLYASYSRSAWLAAVVAAAAMATISVTSQRLRIIIATALSALLMLGGAGYLLLKDSSFVQTVIIHEDPENQARRGSSNAQHLESVTTSFERAAQEPLGKGIGSTGSASYFGEDKVVIENQYLYTAHESGWLGLVLLVLLQSSVLAMLYRNRRDWVALSVCASGIGLVVIGLTLPVFTDDTLAYLWWGLAAVGTFVIKKRENYASTTQSPH